MLALDFLLFIKKAETRKPLKNTTGFTDVCIFKCQCFNINEAKGSTNLCSCEFVV